MTTPELPPWSDGRTRPPGLALLLCAAAIAAAPAVADADKETPDMFSQAQFDLLGFLIGDWRGTAPDGSVFFERYQRAGADRVQSLRFASEDFAEPSDGSTLSLHDGAIEARWGEFTWQASRIGPGEACFEPVNAPSAFCWRADGPDRLTVTQRWADAAGAEQSVQIVMARVIAAR